MSDKEVRNIFISHYNKDAEYIEKLKQLADKQGYELRNSSFDGSEQNNASSTEYIKSLIKPKLDWASTVIVLIGPRTHTRPWVDWEIEEANKKGKRIIGVFLPGAKDSDLPEKFNDYGDATIGWNSEKLVDAIEGDNIWLNTSGEPRPDRTMPHGEC